MKIQICKICFNKTTKIFMANVLGKYPTNYYKCRNCGFIQTGKPIWLKEAYKKTITDLDIGLLQRNIHYSKQIKKIINTSFDRNANYLDYAGGFGIFTRLMRDYGYNYYHYDSYCSNIFAEHFSRNPPKDGKTYQFITAFELFEHVADPEQKIKELFVYTNTVIFTTELVPRKTLNDVNDWWYFVPDTGQHISFYTKKSFKILASRNNARYYNIGNLHILTKDKIRDPFNKTHINKFKIHKYSKIPEDFSKIKEYLINNKSYFSKFQFVINYALYKLIQN